MSKKHLHFYAAMPTDGEGIEYLDSQRYATAIHNDLKPQFKNYSVTVTAVQNDGTEEDRIILDGEVIDRYHPKFDSFNAPFQDAQDSAFVNEECYPGFPG